MSFTSGFDRTVLFGRCLLAVTWVLIHLMQPSAGAAEAKKQILMIAGPPSHGYGAHEHYAGLRILADVLQASGLNVEVNVVKGWPQDDTLVQSADSIVVYSDGGGGHVALPHRDALAKRLKQGAGFVCLHYATEVPKGDPGDFWLKWQGGYFETHWSVNPHWVARFDKLPTSPVTRGVKPFATNDEWYFHLRFAETGGKVTPILQAVAPEDTMRRGDGPHSGNPAVRKSVAAKEPQTVAWTFEREDGGRSFGFTGGHFHWNWGNPNVLRLVSNAIVWTAKAEVPEGGVKLPPVGMSKLQENQDFAPPPGFNPQETAKQFSIDATASKSRRRPRALYASPVITTKTAGHRVNIDVAIKDVKDLYLVINDGGDGYSCDWANWIKPTLHAGERTLSLLDLNWVNAQSGWGTIGKNRNAGGQPIRVLNEEVKEPAIGAHATSVIHFQIPAGFDRFTATGALDAGGASQQNGDATSVTFELYADAAPLMGGDQSAIRDPENATAGLTVADGLEVTLAASEPELRSLTNLDIDDRGRVWVCDVMNYRGNQGSRLEGDRILILEDTDHDGVMDKSKVFYQGRDIDSAMGLCILGNDVIVSAAPYVWKFTDDNGDDVPDHKVALYTQTGQPQHDHSNHSFIFGPDGRLYWNFGNTGRAVKDAEGKVVADIHGRPVIDNGKPFYGGMIFRSDRDGSNFEVLAHNFRNNWETTIDSFGTLWQSDNDDDGNRGTRINFVMEHGNYGYTDELTGAAWQASRINMEQEIPQRHWHLNDPGVVPNLLQTGAGSPSGICVYEAEQLPERYRDQMIHCDPGPNVVRAYPVSVSGAGYTATIDPLLTGQQDRWFRPADVCVAPDGSLFVTDWYDPGVGGHRQEDTQRGRLFRISAPGTEYRVPTYQYDTPEHAVEALASPTQAVRFKAWMALNKMGRAAEPALTKMVSTASPRLKARAIWLLGQIEGRGEQTVTEALKHSDADLRIVGLRLMRQLRLSPNAFMPLVLNDPSPAVRREALVALRFDKSPEMPQWWAQLAKQHQGDRWYLEALGIASDLRASECYAALQQTLKNDFSSPLMKDVIWRLRAPESADLLARWIAESNKETGSPDRYFRALEYLPRDLRTAALVKHVFQLATKPESNKDSASDMLIIRALERIDQPEQYLKQAELQLCLTRYMQSLSNPMELLALIKRFPIANQDASLLQVIMAGNDDSAAVEAVRLFANGPQGNEKVANVIRTESGKGAVKLVRVIGLLGDDRMSGVLAQIATDRDLPFEERSEAVKGMLRSKNGPAELLSLISKNQLPDDLKLLAGGLLAKQGTPEMKQELAKWIALPAQSDAQPLAPLDELAKMSGNAVAGQQLFASKATCANCHVVNGAGKQVGPDLSEIGSKLSREAMFTSILAPSAGISHNYENFIVLLESGQTISGLKVSETDQQVTIRTAEAIDRTFAQDEITEIKQSEKSIMPDNLHQLVDQQGLVDIVEYMTTLKKK